MSKLTGTISAEIVMVQQCLTAEAVAGKIVLRDYKVPVLGEEDLVTEEFDEEMDLVGEEGENEDNKNF